MKVIPIGPISAFGTKCYLVINEKNNAVLVDAPDEAEYILNIARKNNCTIKKILLTHGHCDHIGAAAQLQRMTDCEIYIHENDAKKLSDSMGNLSEFFGLMTVERVSDFKSVKDGDKIILDELEFEVIHTPGHTSGSVCYTVEDTMFSGDTLFNLSIGRTDMPDGSMSTLSQSLKKLREINKNYIVYPGHMDKTTLDFERENNPYLY